MKKEIGQRVGHRIKVRRAELELSQSDLAEAIGISQSHMSYLEKGIRPMTLEMLEKTAVALQCSISHLLYEDSGKRAA